MARPTLPRLRRGRARGGAGDVVERTEPRVAELSADGLTWVYGERPGALEVSYLAERFGFHELDIEDVLSKRQRPKIDEYPEYLFVVLHFPFYDKAVRRLNAAGWAMMVSARCRRAHRATFEAPESVAAVSIASACAKFPVRW